MNSCISLTLLGPTTPVRHTSLRTVKRLSEAKGCRRPSVTTVSSEDNMWARLLSMILLTSAIAFQGRASSICAIIALPDGQPLRRATLKVASLDEPSIQHSAIVDSNGKACVPHLAEGFYSVEASASGFLNAKYYPVRVVFPDDMSFSFRLPFGEIREGMGLSEATLSGTLLDHGKPTDGVKICL